MWWSHSLGPNPDLTPYDFFVWGFVKDRLYRIHFLNSQELKIRIADVFTQITDEMRRADDVWYELEHRLHFLRTNTWGRVELQQWDHKKNLIVYVFTFIWRLFCNYNKIIKYLFQLKVVYFFWDTLYLFIHFCLLFKACYKSLVILSFFR